MSNSNDNSTLYNNYMNLPSFPHKIIEYLISSKEKSAQDLWKILKYDTVDALDNDDLTYAEKNELRWLGQTPEDDYRIFFKPLIGDSLPSSASQTQIRLYRHSIIPSSDITSIVNFEIDFYTNEVTSIVEYNGMYVERSDLMETLFLDLFNGRDIYPIGILEFSRDTSNYAVSSISINNNKTFFGRSLIISATYVNEQSGGACD